MAWIWTCFLLLSVCSAFYTGKTADLAAAAIEGGRSAVQLILCLAGPICLWSGVSHVLSDLKITDRLCGILTPFLGRLFPNSWRSQQIRQAICTNVSANLLGLGNAATPSGVQAITLMSAQQPHRASNEMCRFIIINTASIQLLPTTIAAFRASLGAAHPFDILPAVWVTSACALIVGLLTAKVLSRWM